MDSFCRVVLSVDAPEAPFAVVEDTVDAIGGNVFLLEILRRGIAAIESKRDSLTHIKIAGCIPRAYPEDVVCHPAVSLSNILELAGAARDNETSSILTDAGRKRKSVLICLDGVSDLLFTQQSSQVYALLHQMQRADCTHSLIAAIHTDLHESQVIAAVESMASCILSVSPPPLRHPVLQASHLQHPDGRFEVVIKRRNGRCRVEAGLYYLLPDWRLDFVQPDNTMAALSGSTNTELAVTAKRAAGMRIALTEKESVARKNVVLPWEQHQAGRTSQDDFTQPLDDPSSKTMQATGTGPGQIIYERESDLEHDSDEDPDDDLDI